jgi:lariat debranching enzyme
VAPLLTIFVGGNHEAVAHSRELLFGGYAAPNIYFLGHSNVLTLRKGQHTLTLAGISGIFNYASFPQKGIPPLPLD